MNIQRTSIQTKSIQKPEPTKKTAQKSENATTQDSVTIKNVITKGAILTGGATIGLGLGVASGQYMASLTGSGAMTAIVGAACGLGGAASALALAESEDPATTMALGAMSLGYVATGAAIGEFAGQNLTALTGNHLYSHIGWLAGSLSGAGVASVSTGIIPTEIGAAAVKGLTTGLAGGAAGALVGSGLTYLTGQSIWQSVVPALGATAGTLSEVAKSLNS